MSNNTSRIKYLFKNTFIFALGNIGTKMVSFFLVPMYTDRMQQAEYGTVDLIITLSSFIVPILILNINEAIMRFSLDRDSDKNSIMSTGIMSLLFMVLLATVLYPLILLYEPISAYSLYVYFYFISSGLNTVFLYNLRGREKLLLFSIGSIINAFSTAALNILFLVVLDWGIPGFMLAYILGNLITAIYAFFAGNVIKTIRHFHFDKKLTVQMIKYSVVLIPNSFMWWIMNASNRVMLTAMVGIGSAGLFAVANKLPSLISVVSSVFNQAWNYSAIKEDSTADREKFNNQVFDYLFGIVCLVGTGLLLVLKPILLVYVEQSYFSSWAFTPPLIVATCILVISTFLSSQYTVNKDSKGFLLSATVGAVINIALNLALIPLFQAFGASIAAFANGFGIPIPILTGEFGAAVATCSGYLAVLVYRTFDTKKYINIKVFTLKHILTLVFLLVSAISVYLGYFGYALGAVCMIGVVIIYAKTMIGFAKPIIGKLMKKNKK